MQSFINKLRVDVLYLLFGLLPLFFLADLLFLKDPLIWSDEVIYVDIAKGFLESGRLSSELFGNAVYGLKTIAAWYPPLYFYLLAFWIKLFGSSVESVRSLSLLLAALALINVYFIGKLLFKKRLLALLAMILIATDYFFGRSSRIARMDILNFCLLSYSYWFYLISQAKQKYLLISGIFAGLALLTHPLGLIGILVVSLHLIFTAPNWQVRLTRLALFGFPIFLAGLYWLYSLEGQWLIFAKQWGLQMARKNKEVSYTLDLWQNSLAYWKGLFLAFAAAFGFIFFHFFALRKANDLFLLLGLVISTVLLWTGKEMFYPLYYQPFVALIFVTAYVIVRRDKPWTEYFFWGGMAVVFWLNFQFFQITLNDYGAKDQNYAQYGAKIQKLLPQRATVYLSALPDPYFVLQKNTDLKFLEFPTMFTTDKQYYELLDQADYVVYNNLFDTRFLPYLEINRLSEKAINIATHYGIMVTKLKPKRERQWPKK